MRGEKDDLLKPGGNGDCVFDRFACSDPVWNGVNRDVDEELGRERGCLVMVERFVCRGVFAEDWNVCGALYDVSSSGILPEGLGTHQM